MSVLSIFNLAATYSLSLAIILRALARSAFIQVVAI